MPQVDMESPKTLLDDARHHLGHALNNLVKSGDVEKFSSERASAHALISIGASLLHMASLIPHDATFNVRVKTR